MAWDPRQYLKFGGERLRPAQDLLARVALDAPRYIVDLGCGTGAVTALIRARWPGAQIAGVDNSRPMLERARTAVADAAWEFADLAKWTPAAPPDLLVSNAALHWLDDHATLFPRLMSHLRPGGVLAVQMPAQHAAPSHQIGYALAESGAGATACRDWCAAGRFSRRTNIIRCCDRSLGALDLWFIEYVQALAGDNPVAEFTKGSFVGAWLSALSGEEARDFEAEYRRQIAAAYPVSDDGVTLFPFRRFFLIAQR